MFANVQPGDWVTISSNMSLYENEKNCGEVISNPMFIISKEDNGTFMSVDQKLSHLIWYTDKFRNLGQISGMIEGMGVSAQVKSFKKISLDEMDSTNLSNQVIEKAKEIKEKFLKNHPDLKNVFF